MSVTKAGETDKTGLGLGRKFVDSTMWMSAAQIGSYVLSFGANIILARLLAPDQFGVFALATSILSFFSILASWSFSLGVIQADEMDQSLFDTAWILSLGLGLGIFLLVVVASLILRRFCTDQVVDVILMLAVSRIPQLLSAVYSAPLERGLNYRSVSMVQMISNGVAIAMAVGLAAMGFGVWSLVGKEVVLALGRLGGMRSLSSWRFRGKPTKMAGKKLFSFGSNMLFASGLASFLTMFQGFMIGTMLGNTALGYFDRALKLSQLGVIAAGAAVNNVALSLYARLRESEGQTVAFERINYVLVRGFGLVAIMFLLLGKDITVLLYGEQWLKAGELLQVFSFYTFALMVFANIKQMLYSHDVGQVVVIRLVQSGLLVVGLIGVLKVEGVIGAAWVVNGVYLVGVALAFWYARRYVDIRLKTLFLAPIVASVLIVLPFYSVGGIEALGIPNQYARVGLGMMIVTGVYVAVLGLMERRRLQDNVGYLVKGLRADRI
jgi:O-antigen/teichoic acid export membrane protein